MSSTERKKKEKNTPWRCGGLLLFPCHFWVSLHARPARPRPRGKPQTKFLKMDQFNSLPNSFLFDTNIQSKTLLKNIYQLLFFCVWGKSNWNKFSCCIPVLLRVFIWHVFGQGQPVQLPRCWWGGSPLASIYFNCFLLYIVEVELFFLLFLCSQVIRQGQWLDHRWIDW